MPRSFVLRGKRFLVRPLTLLLVHHRGSQVKSVKLPLWLAVASGLMVSAMLLVAVLACIRTTQMQAEMVELTRLRQVNSSQQAQLQSLEQQAQTGTHHLSEIQILEQKVRSMVGLGNRSQASRSRAGSGRHPTAGDAPGRPLQTGRFDNCRGHRPGPDRPGGQFNQADPAAVAERSDCTFSGPGGHARSLAGLRTDHLTLRLPPQPLRGI